MTTSFVPLTVMPGTCILVAVPVHSPMPPWALWTVTLPCQVLVSDVAQGTGLGRGTAFSSCDRGCL